MLSVSIVSGCVPRMCVSMCVSVCVEDCGLHCHLSGTHNIRKHLKLYLHLPEILGGRSFLIIVSFQHSTNSDWVGVLVRIYSTVWPLPRHGRFPSVFLRVTKFTECLYNLQPTIPLHKPLFTRMVWCIVSHGMYETTPVHQTLSSSLFQPHSSTTRVPNLHEIYGPFATSYPISSNPFPDSRRSRLECLEKMKNSS
jgi:hypothetical protein